MGDAVIDEADTRDFMMRRVKRQVMVARGWQMRLIRALRHDELADCHPDAARWQRNAYMARARRIRSEFAAIVNAKSEASND